MGGGQTSQGSQCSDYLIGVGSDWGAACTKCKREPEKFKHSAIVNSCSCLGGWHQAHWLSQIQVWRAKKEKRDERATVMHLSWVGRSIFPDPWLTTTYGYTSVGTGIPWYAVASRTMADGC